MADELSKALVSALERIVAAQPDRCLSEAGWNTACGLALREYWSDVATPEAAKMLTDYIGEPFGCDGYEWTFRAAKTIAAEYVADFGEPTSTTGGE